MTDRPITPYPQDPPPSEDKDRWCWAHDSEHSTKLCDCPEEVFV
jgi:hypothetical protein